MTNNLITLKQAKLRRLRVFIGALPDERFDMREWICGTAACIGGWAEQLYCKPPVKPARPGDYASFERTRQVLGLNQDQAEDLFYMGNTERDLGEVQRAHAVRVLQHLEETGVVDWDWAFGTEAEHVLEERD